MRMTVWRFIFWVVWTIKTKKFEAFNMNISSQQLFVCSERKGFDIHGQKLCNWVMKILKFQELIGVIVIKIMMEQI